MSTELAVNYHLTLVASIKRHEIMTRHTVGGQFSAINPCALCVAIVDYWAKLNEAEEEGGVF